MGKVTLTLGGVAFQDMEVPEAISFGGRQRVAVQELIGGGRAVQALGVDEGIITFSGIFSGSDAAVRAQLLDAARTTGAALPLMWDSFYYLVIIEQFAAEYRKPNLIPFEIACIVVDNVASAVVAPLASLVGSDLAVAENLGVQAGISMLGLGLGSAVGYEAARGQVDAVMTSSGAAVRNAGTALDTVADAGAGAGILNGLSAGTAQLAAAANMRGYLNRAAVNLGMA
ncbi:hypothetical protein [Acidocella aromatica]|uniref:Uncharacterized protein n=1 Tax=Acidocella aromatica TaxID=1303579 RepID=A0A840VN89_9PROT|nr:hypothetical protein [Acidocella aromatica]MBB5373639.1 hypothetical protein [Acidocella aromatica]